MTDPMPPWGHAAYTFYDPDGPSAGEQFAIRVGRLQSSNGAIPVLFFHDYLEDSATTLDGAYEQVFNALAGTAGPLLVPELGGTSQWATTDVVGTSGYVDDVLVWAQQQTTGTPIGTRADKVAIVAYGMGTLNALNWAWRNPGKVLSLALVGPIVDADKFYSDNPSLQATINADWGSGAAWTAALPTIDPMQNLDLVRPFGHRIGLWYGSTDTQIDAADVQAFAELVGATATEFTGGQAQRWAVPPDQVAAFTLATMRNRASVYLGWDSRDLGRIQTIALTLPPGTRNTYDLRTAVHPGGRRLELERLSGTQGNERHLLLVPELAAVDSMVQTVWFQQNGGLMVGQHGTAHAAEVAGGSYRLTMAWGDIFGVTPWKVNMGVWTGTVDGNDLALHGNLNADIPGLRLASGGEVLASERIGGVVTLVVHQADLDRNLRSRTLDVDIDGPLGDHLIIGAERVDANHLRYAQAGADIPNGGAGSWADFGSTYPFRADTQWVGGDTLIGRFYPLGIDPPPWGDPDFTMEWTDAGGDSAQGYHPVGLMLGHIGIFAPNAAGVLMQQGRTIVDEL